MLVGKVAPENGQKKKEGKRAAAKPSNIIFGINCSATKYRLVISEVALL